MYMLFECSFGIFSWVSKNGIKEKNFLNFSPFLKVSQLERAEANNYWTKLNQLQAEHALKEQEKLLLK